MQLVWLVGWLVGSFLPEGIRRDPCPAGAGHHCYLPCSSIPEGSTGSIRCWTSLGVRTLAMLRGTWIIWYWKTHSEMNFQERTRARAERESSIGRGGSGRHFRPKPQQLSAVQPQHAGFPHQFHLYLLYSLQVKVQLQAWLHSAVGWEARISPLDLWDFELLGQVVRALSIWWWNCLMDLKMCPAWVHEIIA